MSDWRLMGQEGYLMGVTLHWRQYQSYRPGWEHNHCEFCSAKISCDEKETCMKVTRRLTVIAGFARSASMISRRCSNGRSPKRKMLSSLSLIVLK